MKKRLKIGAILAVALLASLTLLTPARAEVRFSINYNFYPQMLWFRMGSTFGSFRPLRYYSTYVPLAYPMSPRALPPLMTYRPSNESLMAMGEAQRQRYESYRMSPTPLASLPAAKAVNPFKNPSLPDVRLVPPMELPKPSF